MSVKSRTRSLARINHKILKESSVIESTLCELLTRRQSLNVLEVGFGWGRALLELAWRFRDAKVTFHGVDICQKPPMEKREDLRAIARQFEIIPPAEVIGIELPHVFFYDATCLHFNDESMDLIYSAVAVQFMERKAEFLEEVCRVLRPGGMALLHIGEANWSYPYSLICHDKILTPWISRFVLKYGNELIPLPVYLKLFEGDDFNFQFTQKSRCSIFVSKLKSKSCPLLLEYNRDLSIEMKELQHRDRSGKIKDGFRSVYDVRPEVYRRLLAEGLLSREQLRTDIQIPEEFLRAVS